MGSLDPDEKMNFYLKEVRENIEEVRLKMIKKVIDKKVREAADKEENLSREAFGKGKK